MSREDFVNEYQGVVAVLAQSFTGRLPASLDTDDLRSIGFVTLLEIAQNLDPDRQATLPAYVRQRVRGAMLDAISGVDDHEELGEMDLADMRNRPADVVMISGEIDALIEALPRRQKQVLEMRRRDLTLDVIGRKLGISRQAACRLEQRAKANLSKLAA